MYQKIIIIYIQIKSQLTRQSLFQETWINLAWWYLQYNCKSCSIVVAERKGVPFNNSVWRKVNLSYWAPVWFRKSGFEQIINYIILRFLHVGNYFLLTMQHVPNSFLLFNWNIESIWAYYKATCLLLILIFNWPSKNL